MTSASYKGLLRLDEDNADVDLVYITPKIIVASDTNDVERVNEVLLEKHPSTSNTYMIVDLTEQQTGTCLIPVLYFASLHF